MDYGRELAFGVSITPANAQPEAPVRLAQLADRLGFALVSFQDHPYQPRFLDTWTLLAFVAARTEHIHVAPNVLNLPLRPPAVLARAAASLDLLSGGRLDLGVGAGAFWDAIEAMGARRLSPGRAVDALEEAIEVIRGIWAVDAPGPLHVGGEHYRVDGADRGPEPAHQIPIWIGAYKPRMLSLVGRAADGWWPSRGYLEGPGTLAASNRVVDDAAEAAGRDPREVRRLLNVAGSFEPRSQGPGPQRPPGPLAGPPRQWVDDLARLALEHGIDTFVLHADDPILMQRFAEEVAPALRELVDRERLTSGVPRGPVRSRAGLALRRPGIAYDDVPAGLAVIEPGDFGYGRVRSTYLRGGSPGIVLQPASVGQVVEAIGFARRHRDVPLGIRSRGHGISGRSTNDGGIVIDLRHLDAIEVLDERQRLVRIGPGARWLDVAAALAPYGWALSSGDYGGVGVGGLATAGGIGWLVREHGLTIDHLRAAELVLADGSVVTADADTDPELFWAVRGAGANLGVVTSFDFQVDEVGDVGWAQLVLDAGDAAGLMRRWGDVVESAPRDLTSFLTLGGRRSGEPRLAQVHAMVDSADPETIIDRLQPIADVAPLAGQSVQVAPYAAVMANAADGPQRGVGEPNARSGLLGHITSEFADAAADLVDSGAAYFLQFRAVGGAVSDVPEDATAYAHRSASFSVAAFGADAARLDAAWSRLATHFDGMYLSFDSSTRPGRIADAYPPATLARLRAVKARVDPSALFADNFPLGHDAG